MKQENPWRLVLGLLVLLVGGLAAALMPEIPQLGPISVLVGLVLLVWDPGTRAAFKVVGRATMVTSNNLLILLPFLVLVGGLGSVLAWWTGSVALDHLVKPNAGQQTQLLVSELTKLFLLTVWGVLTAPLLDAVSIYAWRNRDGERSFSGAINYMLNRFRRMFGPHAVSFTAVSLGMSVIIPGIMFGLWWAWVDAITATRERTLDPILRSLNRDPDSRSPLQWSRVLSRGHRGRILRAWLPYAFWYVPAAMYLVYQAEGSGLVAVLIFGSFNMFLLTIMEMAMVGLFEERLDLLVQQAEARGIDIDTDVEEGTLDPGSTTAS